MNTRAMAQVLLTVVLAALSAALLIDVACLSGMCA